MRRGALRHRLAAYRPDAYDPANEPISYALIGRPWAKVSVQDVGESGGSDYQGTELAVFTIPYAQSIEFDYLDMIIVHRGREYDVKGVKNVDYADKELRVTATRYDGASRVL